MRARERTDAPAGERGTRLTVTGRRAARRRARRRRRIAIAVVALCALLPASYLGCSVVAAVRTPGNESFRAKWADWLRAHHGAAIVTPFENWYYQQHQPGKGGRPRRLNHVPVAGAVLRPAPGPRRPAAVPGLPRPADVPLLVRPGLPGEGHWQPTGTLVDGRPTMYEAQFRADQTYTGQITSAVWIDPTLTRVRLVPGAHEPGGRWTAQPCIGGATAAHALAAFNGGFRFQDAGGGFYDEGRVAVPLRDGAASIVIYDDGHLAIGDWGRDVRMAPGVESVLQNLTLMIDHGHLDPDIAHNDTHKWGQTLKGKIVVARSGIGMTADGALIYVAGPALTARTLAESLQRAGAVEAMALDLNPEWVTFNFYEHPNRADPGALLGVRLYPTMQRPASRYECPTPESRDFFTVTGR